MKYTAIYARKSKDKKDSLSVAFQVQRCINYCEQHDWQYKVYDIDEGYSAGNTRRPGYKQLMNDIEIGIIDKIIIYKYDRISRSTKDFINLSDELQKIGVGIISLKEQFDTTTAFGRAMVMQLMIWAQLEREQTSERLCDNAIDRVSLGRWYGGPTPFGYDKKREIDKNLKKEYAALYINQEQAKFIYETGKKYLEPQSSTRSIAKEYNEKHIPTKRGNTHWTSHQVSWILKNPFYCQNSAEIYEYFKNNTDIIIKNDIEEFDGKHGIILFRKVKQNLDGTRQKRNTNEQYLICGNHQYIFESDMWLKIQEKLEKNNLCNTPNLGHGQASILSGLVYCGQCRENNRNSVMSINGHNKLDINGISYKYFKCTLKDVSHECSNKNIRVHTLEELVEKALFEFVDSETVLKDYAKRKTTVEYNKKEINDEISDISNKILIIKNKISNLLGNFSENISLRPYVEEEISKLDKEKSNLENQLELINNKLMDNENENYSIDLLKEKIKDFKQLYLTADFEQKKILIRYFIKEIIVNNDKIDINFFDLGFSILLRESREASHSNFKSINFLCFGNKITRILFCK